MLAAPLPFKEVESKDYQKRVLFFDPTEAYSRVKINHFSRHPYVSIVALFPDQNGLCACGCGNTLQGRRTRWASKECNDFAFAVWAIISGRHLTISKYLRIYYGWFCNDCGCKDKGHDMGSNGVVSYIKIDHVIPVKHGGGGCWLNNYLLRCHDCHVKKTNQDFGWKKSIKKTELPKLF
jgi:hypothetical protein